MTTVRNLHTGFCLHFGTRADAEAFINAFDYYRDMYEIVSSSTTTA